MVSETAQGKGRTIRQALEEAERRLDSAQDTARLDAQVLLASVLGRDRSYLHAWPERVLREDEHAGFEALVARRIEGEPVAYLTGRREFWSLELGVTPATLIPRPETELLVERALLRLAPGARARIADLGTGSGAIALALARERPGCHVIGVDHSPEALEVAARNAQALGINNVEFHPGDWLEPLAGMSLDMIVSNPPYIAEGDPHLDEGDVRFEPRHALAAGRHGLDAIEAIVRQAPKHLVAGGWLLLEHGYDQGPRVTALLREAGFTEVQSYADIAGHSRVAAGCWPGGASGEGLD